MVPSMLVRVYTIDKKDVECRFFYPELDGNEFVCRYEIDLPYKPLQSKGYGVDAIQALLWTMQKAHVELLAIRKSLGRSVEWGGAENLGLPLGAAFADMAPLNNIR